MWETTWDGLCYRRTHYYGLIMDTYFSWKQWLEVKNIFMMDLSRLSSQDVNWWTGEVWMTCGLLWCFVWTLILTAPIHYRGSIHSIQHIYIFGWTVPFVILKTVVKIIVVKMSNWWQKFWGYCSFKTQTLVETDGFFCCSKWLWVWTPLNLCCQFWRSIKRPVSQSLSVVCVWSETLKSSPNPSSLQTRNDSTRTFLTGISIG